MPVQILRSSEELASHLSTRDSGCQTEDFLTPGARYLGGGSGPEESRSSVPLTLQATHLRCRTALTPCSLPLWSTPAPGVCPRREPMMDNANDSDDEGRSSPLRYRGLPAWTRGVDSEG
ncbi:Nance-Horan syndrome protein [Lates japonicus]|uniref:Nance-Horan syndrome protein n=1 Tax=Lates japonicus TaxID=270547 RepID=A0AAD3NKM8_LATJO|nr:Nance-Horan syndrome protein [Lates japonicus]